MSTPDFLALNETWERNAPREIGEWAEALRGKLNYVETARENLMFSAWLNTLRSRVERGARLC